MNDRIELFKEYYERAFNNRDDNKLECVESIYLSNGLDEDFGDMLECFDALPPEEQDRVLECLKPDAQFGEPGYARALYEEANDRVGYGDKSRYSYEAGVLDFYEALKAEGINLGF